MKFFKKVKEIKSKTGELHFERFAIMEFSRFAVYIHKIYKADKDLHLHSHPWNFWSVILKGSYAEKFLGKDLFGEFQEFTRMKTPLTFSLANRDFFHKIERIESGPVITFFVAWGEYKDWYYFVDVIEEGWPGYIKIESNKYREMKNTGKLKI